MYNIMVENVKQYYLDSETKSETKQKHKKVQQQQYQKHIGSDSDVWCRSPSDLEVLNSRFSAPGTLSVLIEGTGRFVLYMRIA